MDVSVGQSRRICVSALMKFCVSTTFLRLYWSISFSFCAETYPRMDQNIRGYFDRGKTIGNLGYYFPGQFVYPEGGDGSIF